MGADQSQTSGTLTILKADAWTDQGFREDSRYGEFRLYSTPQGRQMAVVTRTCQNYDDYVSQCATLTKSKSLNLISGMVKVLEVCSQQEGNLCSSFYKVTAAYEYFDQVVHDLYEEFQGQIFNTEVVTTLMRDMLGTLAALYNNGLTHGDVTPMSILVVHTDNNNTLQFKLNNVQQMTGLTQYARVLLDTQVEAESLYLAPELLDCLSRRVMRPQYDSQKADVYSLALTCLSVGTGITQIFDLDEIILEASLLRFSLNHGQLLTSLLRQMLQEDVTSRPTFSELLNQFTILSQQTQTQGQTQTQTQINTQNYSPRPRTSNNISPTKTIHTKNSSRQMTHPDMNIDVGVGLSTQTAQFQQILQAYTPLTHKDMNQMHHNPNMSISTTPANNKSNLISPTKSHLMSPAKSALMSPTINTKININTTGTKNTKKPPTPKTTLTSLRRPKQDQNQFQAKVRKPIK